jgi:hypothetical protein
MRIITGFVVAVALFGAGVVAALHASGAWAHSNPCHTQHTCPSDHHTYVWTDPLTGFGWDCAEPGAPEYDPARDTTTIVWDGLTYYCRSAATTPPTTATEPTVTLPTSTTTTPPALALPIKSLTPGVYNAAVRQKTIDKTICVKNWTKKIRPSVSYTNALKLMQMQQYGETGSPSDYEEDHFIPLELGGAPKNPKNLWPEPHAQSSVSDPLETKLKREVCKGLIKLAKARAEIRTFKDANG